MKLAPARILATTGLPVVEFDPDRAVAKVAACRNCAVIMAEAWKVTQTGRWAWTTRGVLTGNAPTRKQALDEAIQAAYRDLPTCNCYPDVERRAPARVGSSEGSRLRLGNGMRPRVGGGW